MTSWRSDPEWLEARAAYVAHDDSVEPAEQLRRRLGAIVTMYRVELRHLEKASA